LIPSTFDSIPKVHDIDNEGSVKEFEGLSLRTAEVRTEKMLRIDRSVL